MNVETADERDPCKACTHARLCAIGYACQAFSLFVSTGSAGSDRSPDRAIYLQLFGGRELLRAYWRKKGIARAVAVRKGARPKLLRSESWRRWYERRKILLALDPALRERHLRLKREDAIRRARRRGKAPAGSEANRQHRIEGQRRRREAERQRNGQTMSGPEYRTLREQLGLTTRDVAIEMQVSYSAAKQWQRGSAGPPGRVVRWLQAVEAGEIDPVRGRSAKRAKSREKGAGAVSGEFTQAAPAGAVILGNATHA